MNHNRTVNISKKQLIEKLQENKANHIKEYEEAVVAYKLEAEKQLKEQMKSLKNGNLDISVKLTTPINRADQYDKVIEMFNWEVDDIIKLTQDEFNEYVHDENHDARTAKFSNTFYLSKSK